MFKPEIPQYPRWFKWFILPVLYFISILPFSVLYGISNVIAFLFIHVLNYRKDVVFSNLKRAFPEKSEDEINYLAKKYYLHLSDLFVETIKCLSMSKKEVLKRMRNVNQDLYESFFVKNQNCIVVMSHCGNWEWVCLMSQLTCKQQVYSTYKPLSHQGFNAMMYAIRTKFGSVLVSMNETLRMVLNNENERSNYVIALLGDQNPANTNNVYWASNFLNQETAFLNGPAKMAKRFNIPMVYLSSTKLKRGFYEAHTELLVANPSLVSESEISEILVKRIEQEIISQPEIWLWSHRRWKYQKKRH